jgi:hypothetical protein
MKKNFLTYAAFSLPIRLVHFRKKWFISKDRQKSKVSLLRVPRLSMFIKLDHAAILTPRRDSLNVLEYGH